MEKEAFIKHLLEEFDKLVEEFIPANETGYKEYAKQNINPLLHWFPNLKMAVAVRSFYDGIANQLVQFEGSSDCDEHQFKYTEWSMQLTKLFFPIITDAFLNNPLITATEKNIFNEKIKDFCNELAFQLPVIAKPIKEIADYVIDKTTKNLGKFPANLYYWDYEPTKLIDLYNLLLSNNLIEANEKFINSFSILETKPAWKTNWKKDIDNQTSLFALLYLIYGKCQVYKNEQIGTIAHKLFKLKNSTSSNHSINTAFARFVKRDKKEYLSKNHPTILQIVKQLNLDKQLHT